MAGFSSFFTSLTSSLKSVRNVQYYNEEDVLRMRRNSTPTKVASLREIREDKTNAPRKQVSGQASKQVRTIVDVAEKVSNQSREAGQARVHAAHETIGAQTKLGRTAVSYGAREQSLKSKLKTVDKKIIGLGQGSKRGREDRDDQAPLQHPVSVKKQKTKAPETPAPVLERVGPPKQVTEREREMTRWQKLAKRHLRNKDVTSVTINGETLTRKEAVYWGWVRGDGKGGGRNGGGGRGMGG